MSEIAAKTVAGPAVEIHSKSVMSRSCRSQRRKADDTTALSLLEDPSRSVITARIGRRVGNLLESTASTEVATSTPEPAMKFGNRLHFA
jgi:hypothetical protein